MTDAQNQSRPRRSRKNPTARGRSTSGRTATGHRRRITVSGRSEKEAAQKLRDKITQLDKGIPVAGESWTVQQYFGYWLNHLVKVKATQDLPGLRGHRAPLHHARSRPAEATVVAS